MEGIGIILPVRDAGDLAVAAAVDGHEAPAQAFGGGGDERKIEAGGLGFVVAALAHVGHDVQPQALGLLALAMMRADERLERLGKTDEAHRERAVLEHLAHAILPAELFRIQPDAVAHEERIIAYLLGRLDLVAVHELPEDQIDLFVQQAIEGRHVAARFQAEARQVDGREAQIAAAARHLTALVVHVAQHAGTAAHIGHFGVVAPVIILQVERRVDETEVGEEPHGRGGDGQLEQIVVGVAGVVVHPFLDLEDLHREDGRFPAAQPGLRGQQQVLHHHAALGRGIRTVVDRTERHLCSGAGVHGVEIVHEGFHSLIGTAIRTGKRLLRRIGVRRPQQRTHVLGDEFLLTTAEFVTVVQADTVPGGHTQLVGQGSGLLGGHVGPDAEVGGQRASVFLAEGLGHAAGHAVVEVGHALSAVHLVLIGLDGDAGQRGITLDGLRLAQIAVPGGEAVAEQSDKVYLTAGLREHVEIFIVDMDIAVAVRGRSVLGQDVIVREVLGPLGTVFEHGAHSRIAVDIGVLPLDVLLTGRGIGQGLVDLHEVGLGIAQLGMLGPVQDIGLGRTRVVVADERLLHHVLDLFHMGEALLVQLGAHLVRQEQQIR